jgi:hypothetical protein
VMVNRDGDCLRKTPRVNSIEMISWEFSLFWGRPSRRVDISVSRVDIARTELRTSSLAPGLIDGGLID